MSYAPFIVVPPLTSCKDSYIVFGQGTPPYTFYPIHSGDGNGTLLQNLPKQASAGYYKWLVDFNPGANLTFVLVDGAGASAYSDFRVVQANEQLGANHSCPTTKDLPTHASNAGAIAGGVLGALAVLALVAVTAWYVRRRLRHPAPPSPFLRGDGYDDDPAGQAGAPGVRRAGTFNLHQVEFHPDSVVELRALDPPPNYIPGAQVAPKRRVGAWRRAVAAASGSGAGVSGDHTDREHGIGVADEDVTLAEGDAAGTGGAAPTRDDEDGATLKDGDSNVGGEPTPPAAAPTAATSRTSADYYSTTSHS